MPKKKTAEKPRKKLVLTVSEETARLLEAPSPGISRGELLDRLLRDHVHDLDSSSWPKVVREEVRKRLLEESAGWKQKAGKHLAAGHRRRASVSHLLAASLELRALACLADPNEATIQSTVIEVLCLLREAAGYRRLPSLPDKERRSSESVH